MSYPVAVAQYVATTGQEPEHEWDAFLYLVCAAGIWENVKPFVHFTAESADPESFRGVDPGVLDELALSSGERLMLQLALHLFNPRNPSPSLADLVTTLDDQHYQTVLAALTEFRARVRSGG